MPCFTTLVSAAKLSIYAIIIAVMANGTLRADLTDNFNSENGGVGQLNYTGFANFNVTAGSVDLIGNGFYDFYPGHGLYVDLNGSTGVSGTLTSKMDFGPGNYTFSFEIGNNPSNSALNLLTVSLGNYSESFTRSGTVPLETITREVDVTTASPLIFATPASDNDDIGIIIDDVNVVTTTTAVPEPSSLLVVASTTVCMMGYQWRRREQADAADDV